MNTFHQGDVQGRKIQVLPEGAKIIKNTPLAYGEHSGHVHQITGEVELYEYDGKFIAVIGSDGAFLQHVHETTVAGKEKFNAPLPKADHHPVHLPAGIYEFGIHKRYNPFSKVFERVID
jgi:hypothetical protein